MDSEKLKILVERRHPEYQNQIAHWNFLEGCYFGGRDWLTENIFRYLKEGDSEYADRVDRAYRFNHTKEVVDLVTKYVIQASKKRKEDAPVALQEFWARTTKGGQSIDEFMRIAATKSSVGGRAFAVIDQTRSASGKEVVSKKDEKDEDIRTYAYLVSPKDVLDMAWDDEGRLKWILIREWKRDDESPTASGKIKERFRLWEKDQTRLIEQIENKDRRKRKAYRVTETVNHELGMVPVVPVDQQISAAEYYVPALISDIAYLDRATANYGSNLDAIIQDQTFSQLAMPGQGLLPGEDAYDKMLEMGTKRMFIYDGESGNPPQYISPDPRQAELILKVISQLISEIYHSVGLAGERTKEDNAKGIDNSSGVAKEKDFERVVALLSSKSAALELAENRIAEVVLAWEGKSQSETKDWVQWGSDFSVTTLMNEIDIAIKLSLVGDLGSKVVSKQNEIIIEKLFPGLAERLIQGMKEESATLVKSRQETEDFNRSELDREQSSLMEEAGRDRDDAGAKQSDTKSRETDSR